VSAVCDPAALAARLVDAVDSRTAIAKLTIDEPDLDLDAAYAIQATVVQARLDRGERIVGAKLGLTSRAKQQAMGVSDPLYGWLTSGMATASGEALDLGRFIQPRVEPEIAFLLADDIEAPASVTSVLAATECVFPAIDVLDSRYVDYGFTLPDVVADNASGAAFMLGSVTRKPSEAGDLRLTGVVLRRNGEVVATAAGGAVMGHPAASVAWLVNRLAERGEKLRAGMIVLSGGLTAPVPLTPGTTVTAEFDGLGVVEVRA
jgi:2-oxo-3-hexenedioate decarboxylase